MARTARPDALWWPEQKRQSVATHQLAPEREPHQLGHPPAALRTAMAPRVIRPQAPARIDHPPERTRPIGIERRIAGIFRKRPVVGLRNRPEIRANRIVENPRDPA